MKPRNLTASARALAVLVAVVALLPSAADAAPAKPKVAPAEARAVTRQALAQTAGLIDAKKVVVRDCRLNGDRARCVAILRGSRQTLRATVAIRELRDSYVVRVLRLG